MSQLRRYVCDYGAQEKRTETETVTETETETFSIVININLTLLLLYELRNLLIDKFKVDLLVTNRNLTVIE